MNEIRDTFSNFVALSLPMFAEKICIPNPPPKFLPSVVPIVVATSKATSVSFIMQLGTSGCLIVVPSLAVLSNDGDTIAPLSSSACSSLMALVMSVMAVLMYSFKFINYINYGLTRTIRQYSPLCRKV